MSPKSKIALTASFILGFATLGVVFYLMGGSRPEVEMALTVACAVSIFSVWLAASVRRE